MPAVVTLHAGTAHSTHLGWDAETPLVVCLGPICTLSVTVADDALFCCPAGYSGQDFDWADYQKQCGAEAAPHLCFRNVSSLFAFALLLSRPDCLHRKAASLWELSPDQQEFVLGRKPERCYRFLFLK